MNPLMGAFLVEIALVTWRDLHAINQKGGIPKDSPMHLPLPSAYTAPMGIFAVLALVPAGSGGAKIASLFGWGLVVATALNLWDPSNPTHIGKANPTQLGLTKLTKEN